ncbi:hypothetical protein [Sediminibacterium sp. TEGAF015]|uniref:hypothetical protein n=1 Tax=Sediminibacterium sp. TEGAF015 TaxID=575378 RepID=UPI002203B274|nr:hypothetical protein [Sediminibacterium sp. TEGAF015]BDQ11693.1 hypothetical protein TEGAF0_09100 [Sediminibacterium sp. TEGAF015]
MFEEALKLIGQHYPQLVITIIAVIVTWLFAKFYNNSMNRLKKVEAECQKIDRHLTPQLESISSSLNTLNGSFNSLIVYLKSKDGKMETSLFISKSPIQLTELGKKILVTIGGEDFVNKNLNELITNMDAEGIKTALDCQTFAPIVISKISNHASFNKIKDYAFKNPYYKEKLEDGQEITIPLDMGTISNIMGIYLRDKYLERHPELNPADIPTAI